MLFKTPDLAVHWVRLHPELKQLLTGLGNFCEQWGYPEPIATHILRTRDQQEDIYWKIVLAKNVTLTEQQARNLARHQWTWHFVYCAVDLRDYIYSKEQLEQILRWLRKQTMLPQWEFLYHDVGRGKHLHVGIRDDVWAKTIPIT